MIPEFKNWSKEQLEGEVARLRRELTYADNRKKSDNRDIRRIYAGLAMAALIARNPGRNADPAELAFDCGEALLTEEARRDAEEASTKKEEA